MKHLSPKELKELLAKDSNLFLLDVREDFEHEDYNIGGLLIPLGEVVTQAAVIPRDRLVVVYCRKGIRSQLAIQRLEQKHGFTNLANLAGGMEAWKKEHLL